jgi:hypothetical protein
LALPLAVTPSCWARQVEATQDGAQWENSAAGKRTGEEPDEKKREMRRKRRGMCAESVFLPCLFLLFDSNELCISFALCRIGVSRLSLDECM